MHEANDLDTTIVRCFKSQPSILNQMVHIITKFRSKG